MDVAYKLDLNGALIACFERQILIADMPLALQSSTLTQSW
jgi:hypothetical protein